MITFNLNDLKKGDRVVFNNDTKVNIKDYYYENHQVNINGFTGTITAVEDREYTTEYLVIVDTNVVEHIESLGIKLASQEWRVNEIFLDRI